MSSTRLSTFMLTVALTVLVGGGVAAAQAGAVVVSGTQMVPVDNCNGAGFGFPMTGDLVGCWYTDTATLMHANPNGVVYAGTEHFVGCLDTNHDGTCGAADPTGTFRTTFTFTGTFDTLTGAELHGRCHHPILGGTGDFAGASGVISMHDDTSTGTARYSGPISL